jgi:ABC-2 type transport system permease protein
VLLARRGGDAIGVEQAVPGMAVMFNLMRTESVGLAFYREHGWITWPRLLASRLDSAEILAGKAAVHLGIGLFQLIAVFAVGVMAFGLRLDSRELAGCFILFLAVSVTTVCFGFAVTALTTTVHQLNAVANLGGLVLAALGGALVPVDALPAWAARVAPATPSYWAMRGFRILLEDGGDAVSVLPSAGVLLAFAAGAALVAIRRFALADVKIAASIG